MTESEPPPSVTVTLQDCRTSGIFCLEGGKAFFAKHRLDWRDFVKRGISSAILDALDDQMAQTIVRCARGRQP